MPSREQVAFRAQLDAQKREQEAALAQQGQAQAAALQYGYGSAMQAQQHAYGQQAAQQQAALQYGAASALSQQSHNQQSQLQVQGVDLQARLNEVRLNDEEQMRVRRMERSRARIEDDPTLAPYERQQLITQIETGLNPLENRQREAQMLQSHIQTQGMAQQNDQQATLFNQRQERLAAGAQGRQQVFTDPVTGQRQLFQMDLEGNWQPLDFGLSNERHQMQMQAMQAQTQATQQNTAQSGALFGGQLERQGIDNQTARATLDYMRNIQPHQVEHAQLANQLLTQQVAQGPTRFNMEMLQGYAHTGHLVQQLNQAIEQQPHNLQLLRARADLATMQTRDHPEDRALAQAAQLATTAHTEAETAHTNATVANMPTVQEARQQHGADSQRAQDTAAIARLNLERLRAGGMPEHAASMLVDHAIGGVNREIGHARAVYDQMARNPATDPVAIRQAREHIEQLERDRGAAVQARAAEAEDLVRRVHGMPPANRPALQPAPQPAAQPAPQAQAPFQGDRNFLGLPAAQQAPDPAMHRAPDAADRRATAIGYLMHPPLLAWRRAMTRQQAEAFLNANPNWNPPAAPSEPLPPG